ncbi:MAG: CocE/NonD family hydrolase [Pseudomonadota bacterium]
MRYKLALLLSLMCAPCAIAARAAPVAAEPVNPVDFKWDVKIPMRDGVNLSATLYRPNPLAGPLPCVFTLTPYIGQTYHERGMYFASHGYVFLTVDVRGRGNSEGKFEPLVRESQDGPDIVEWLAKQSYCNGKVAMWGGSYAGNDQWMTAKERPAHLATIIPAASPRLGVDFPSRNNIFYAYNLQWLTLTAGRTPQDNIFDDRKFWDAKNSELFLSHRAYSELDAIVGNASPTFQSWISHPSIDSYWDNLNPTPKQLGAIDIPVLTITGQYDGDQPGALSFYGEHLANTSAAQKARNFLIIGPWDHAGTRTPRAEVGGLTFGAESLLDMNKLHKEWYDWIMKAGPKPGFLKAPVSYYVLGKGAETWRYARSIEAITGEVQPLYLSANGNAADSVFSSGTLGKASLAGEKPSQYIYDPLDVSFDTFDAQDLTDQSGLLKSSGKLLVYHSTAFAKDTTIAGFFKLSAWLEINQPDTDIAAMIYEIDPKGESVFLGSQAIRARYRASLREPKPVRQNEIERYDFNDFPFIARQVARGSRLRLVIAPVNSRMFEKNYNSGGDVANETGKDARTVTVKLYHDAQHPSALSVPIEAK